VQLDHLTVVLRPRRPWQAIDLGIRMASRWWQPLMTLWLCISLPLFLLFTPLLATRETAYLAPLLLWWMKPLLERPLLYFTSRAVFGEQPSLKDVLKNLGNIMRPQALAWLTWRRLSVTRSFDMPVTLLEGLDGKDRTQRLDVLHMQHASPASWLTILGVHIESFLAMAIMLLIESMLPQQIELQWLPADGDAQGNYALWYCLSYVAISLVAPYYTVCGFSLYTNRRAQLEAWDIEVAFRRMREKYSTTATATALIATISLGAAWLTLTPLSAWAQANASTATHVNAQAIIQPPPTTSTIPAIPTIPTTPLQSRQLISDVMQEPTFNEHITYKIPQWFDRKQKEKDTPSWVRWLLKWMRQWRDEDADIGRVSLFIARLLEFALWSGLIVGAALLAWRYRTYLRQWLPSRVQQRPRVWRMRRLAVREGIDLDELPTLDDIGESARTLWKQREPRAAMALLYVASLYELAATGVPLDDSHTETECADIAKNYLDADSFAYFLGITEAWLRQAYAHQPPPGDEFMTMCDQWQRYIAAIHVHAKNRLDSDRVVTGRAVLAGTGGAHGG